MNIYLIGYRCSGKTTLGRALAQRLGWPFVDMDDVIVAESGTSIADMVAAKGWDYFRAEELSLLKRISHQQRQVVGTGGGVILDPQNIRIMQNSGKLAWLRCRAETVRRLLLRDARTAELRPALTDKGLLAEIEETLQARQPLYQAAMDVVLDTDVFDAGKLCNELIAKLEALGIDI